jgi:hypothetical protein
VSPFVLGIFKTLLFEAIAILALVDAPPRHTRKRTAAYALLAGVAWMALLNFGAIHGRGQLPHWAEQFHFDLGDKYLRETHYDGLYPATIAALAERGKAPPPALRDTTTFELVPPAEWPRLSQEAKRRFSPARWTDFGDDLVALLAEDGGCASTGDHGNTASPSGALGPRLLLALIPMKGIGFRLLACADLVMLAAAFLAVWRWGSIRVAAAAFALALLAPLETDFLLGSLFRFDWLAACLGGTIALWRGRRGTAGALFAYAALARPFALAFGICAFVGLLGDWRRHAVDRREVVRFAAFALGCAAALVVVSTLVFGATIWPDYLVRMIATMREGYYGFSHGFRNVYEQIAVEGPRAIFRPIPDFIAAARPGAFQGVGLKVAQGAFALLILFACFRDGAVMGAGAGVLLAFVLTVTNAYYQGMWGVLALACALHAPSSGRARAGLALACAVFASRYVMQHMGEWRYAQEYFANWTTFAFAVVWGVGGVVSASLPSTRASQPGARAPQPGLPPIGMGGRSG